MRTVNKVILIGNLGADPELRYTQSGTAVATLSVATSRKWKDKEGNPQEDIQVIVRRAYNNDYRSGDTIYTDNKGAFAAEKFVTTGFEPDEQKVYFNDEKKVFKSDSILL